MVRIFLGGLFLALGLQGVAMASVVTSVDLSGLSGSISSLSNKDLKATYTLTFLGADSARGGTSFGTSAGSYFDSSTSPGSTVSGVTLRGAYLQYLNTSKNDNSDKSHLNSSPLSSLLQVYRLSADWSANTTGQTFSAGTLLVTMNAFDVAQTNPKGKLTGYTSDGDYNDFVFAATPSSKTPLPGTLLLLGPGLAGLAHFRKKLRKL